MLSGFIVGCAIGYAVFGHYTDKIVTCIVLDLIAVFALALQSYVEEKNR